ncbi:hypothetical protein [Flavobacterium piscis]|uniref:DUF2946 domain-containing protein n=1 Tax=Flavobacterium piscis TaxID=1114874 RepID=A0ABU1Y2D9_9FLAO|nr:hypothetical protein [Flavobacterium piscis]MDR7208382.1 hypothetical protein [Flavobacterium piscis]
MKKRKLITSISLALMVLFSILFQSVHSYEHIIKQLSEKQCYHDYSDVNSEITHQHNDYDSCFVCLFAFGSYIAPEKFCFEIYSSNQQVPYFFHYSENTVSFSGSLYSLRGPPPAVIS